MIVRGLSQEANIQKKMLLVFLKASFVSMEFSYFIKRIQLLKSYSNHEVL